MSHFVVIVVGPDHESQLAPFHEFECTGVDDKFVKDMDVTAETRAEFESQLLRALKRADGTLVTLYDETGYYRSEVLRAPTDAEMEEIAQARSVHTSAVTKLDWTQRGDTVSIIQAPEGAEILEVKATELRSFAHWLVESGYGPCITDRPDGEMPEDCRYGFVLVDGANEVLQVVKRTNPNAKWDWYQVGGRWAGFFKDKLGDECDEVLAGEVDFDKMMRDAREKAELKWDAIHAILQANPGFETAAQVRARFVDKDSDEWRKAYWTQPAMEALKTANLTWDVDEIAGIERSVYAEQCASGAIVPYAILMDGTWIAKGDMGWWGTSNDHGEETEWVEKASKLLLSLPPDTPLTAVDCHI